MFDKCKHCGRMSAINGDCPACFDLVTKYDHKNARQTTNGPIPNPLKTELVRRPKRAHVAPVAEKEAF